MYRKHYNKIENVEVQAGYVTVNKAYQFQQDKGPYDVALLRDKAQCIIGHNESLKRQGAGKAFNS
jgi:hypothetical protein